MTPEAINQRLEELRVQRLQQIVERHQRALKMQRARAKRQREQKSNVASGEASA